MTVRANDSSTASAFRFFMHRARKERGLAGRQVAPRDPNYVSPRQRCLDEVVLRHVTRSRLGASTSEVLRAVRDDFGAVGIKQINFSLWRLVAQGEVTRTEAGWARVRNHQRAA